ncbi:MAG: Bacterial alpha-L-rhamnosidase [Anaerolineaceae bacterium]|nr:Bacterial alpha-L-rhamnosidase [Anaerolineaceae bacterium]
MSTPVTPQDFPEIRWKGHWIWVPEEQFQLSMGMPGADHPLEQETHGLFRKTIVLDTIPKRVPTRITADSRYALYVNGQEVFRGPIRSQPRRLYYDLFDLAPYLKPGENVIAVYVKYYGKPKSYWMPAAPNTVLGKSGILVFEAHLGDGNWLTSDDSWKAQKSEAWSDEGHNGAPLAGGGGGVPIEILDARKLPANWKDLNFDDSAWGNAQRVPSVHIGGFAHTQPPTDPYGSLYPRPIAKLGGAIVLPESISTETVSGLVDETIGSPVVRVAQSRISGHSGTQASIPLKLKVPAGGFVRLMMDIGRIVSGLVQFTVRAPAGTTFDLSYVEAPIKPGPMDFLGVHAGSRYIARGDYDQFEVFDSNGFRYIYLLVHGAVGTVEISHFAVRELIYPWQTGASFSCSDETLNRIYAAGIRTVNLNSHDAFIDCPTREQRAWVGDSVVHQMVHLATNLDWRLAWHYLTLANSPRSDGILPMSVVGDIESSGSFTIPDWALHWVHGVYNLYRFTGDADKVKSFMPTIERILRWYLPYQTSAGVLKDVAEWNLVDWGSLFVEDTSSIVTALWARGLREFAEMAAWLEENASRRWAEALYRKAQTGFEMFWDEARGSYIDHIKEGVPQKPMSQIAGAIAVCSGLAPQERWQRIVRNVTDPQKLVVRSWTGSDSGEYSQEKIMRQMQGIYEANWDTDYQIVIAQPFISYVVHDAVAQAGLADSLPDLYLRWEQFLEGGYDTIGECWGWGTHVHGWSCTPTRDMIFYTLGIMPAEAGYSKVRIEPRLGRLTWAKGTVPSPHGLISVDVTADTLTFDSPVPAVVSFAGRLSKEYPAGQHTISAH